MKKTNWFEVAAVVAVLVALGLIYSRLGTLVADSDFTAQRSVEIRDSVRGLPQNFQNNR